MKIHPYGDRILLKKLDRDQMTEGGIAIPDSVRRTQTSQMGEIISCGEGKILDDGTVRKMKFKPGMVVMFSNFAGTVVEGSHIDGEEFFFINDEDVIAVVDLEEGNGGN